MKQKIDFIRNNPGVSAADLLPISNSFAGRITDENDLNFYLKNLYPIGNAAENEYAINLTKRSGLIADKQLFLYTFWMQRNSRAPESEWLKYKERIDYVAANFAHSNSSGYLTDMGQIYLKYGAPNFVREEKNFIGTQNIHYLPFKMWRYDQLPNNPPNRMFIFWDQYRSGLYTLVNSNANGEKTNRDWERELSQKQLGDGSIGDVGKAFERGY